MASSPLRNSAPPRHRPRIGLELSVIAAVILGGTSLSGGKGSIWGTLLGVLIMGTLNNGLTLLNVPSWYAGCRARNGPSARGWTRSTATAMGGRIVQYMYPHTLLDVSSFAVSCTKSLAGTFYIAGHAQPSLCSCAEEGHVHPADVSQFYRGVTMKREIAACLLGCLSAGIALAEPVGPGQTITVPSSLGNVPVPPGVQIASQTIKFTADITSLDDFLPGFVPYQQTVDGTMMNSVWKDSSGKLSFVYDFRGFPNYDDNLSELKATNFGGFSTDYSGEFGDTQTVERSADGATVTVTVQGGSGTPPFVILTTDATHFNRGGTATFIGQTDFVPGHDAQGNSNILDVQSTANLSGVFQPSSSAAAVPLPPAVYGGSALLGLIFLAQRKRCLHV